MNNSSIRDVLNMYYDGLSNKGDWHFVLSEDILLKGTIAKESRGKEAFVNNNFFKMIKELKVEKMIVEADSACAVAHYDLKSPKGKSFTSEVAEIWIAKEGKLESLAIYFDTAQFQKAMT